MHPVIEHLLKRKNKQLPFPDGRKIVLVLYGGTMTCVRGAAVLEMFAKLGFTNAFDEIYTISGAFPIASYFLSGQTKHASYVFTDDFSGKRLINLFRFWNMFDIDFLMSIVNNKRKLDIKKLFSSKTKLFVGLHNLKRDSIEYPEIHNFSIDGYSQILKAAMSPA